MPMFSTDMLANIIRYYGHAMQGLMGSYLERSIFAFHEAQKRFQEQASTLYGEIPKVPSEAWSQLMTGRRRSPRDGRLPREGRAGRDRHAGGAAPPGAQALLGLPLRRTAEEAARRAKPAAKAKAAGPKKPRPKKK